MQHGTGPEVDQIQFSRASVDEEVLVFDVPMNHAALMDILQDLDDLFEEIPSQTFVQPVRMLTHEIVQVTAVLRPFENEHPTILMEEIIQQVNDVLHFRHPTEQKHFHGNLSIGLEREDEKVPS